MTGEGLRGVDDPSERFLADRRPGVPGSVVVPTLEGRRPLLVEVQALTHPSSLPSPRRSAQGLDSGRLAVTLAVLEQRGGLRASTSDVYAMAVGGVRIDEPGADLGLALAVASSLAGRPVAHDLVAVGEVGLGGELRQVPHLDRRLVEAARHGFGHALVPGAAAAVDVGLQAHPVATLADALVVAGVAP
jgi:DNA repair protein RadA/Sms